MPRVFISYRRDDCAGQAGRLYDRLAARIGDDAVFMDVDTIEPGADFGVRIDQAIGECAVVIALIGDDWLDIADSTGRRRLDDPTDLVRHEIAAALVRKGLDVIPVLVEGAVMPSAEQLPEDLKALARRNALELSDAGWRYDVERLMEVVERVVGTAPALPPAATGSPHNSPTRLPPAVDGDGSGRRTDRAKIPRVPVAAACVLVAGLLGAILLTRTDGSPPVPKPPIKPSNATVTFGSVVSPNSIAFANGRVWVTSARSDELAVFNARTNQQQTGIRIGKGATSVAAGFGFVWVLKQTGSLIRLHRNGAHARHVPILLPGAAGSAAATRATPVVVATGAHAVWVGVRSPDGTPGTLVRIEPRNLAAQKRIAIPGGLADIAVGNRAVWVTNTTRDDVVRVNAENLTDTTDIPVGRMPKGVAVGLGNVWVANSRDTTITRIDPSNNTADATIELCYSPTFLDTGGGALWATSNGGRRLFRINPARSIVRSRQTGVQPFALAIGGHAVWLTLYKPGKLERSNLGPSSYAPAVAGTQPERSGTCQVG